MSGQACECHPQLKLYQKLFVAFGESLFLLSEALSAWNQFAAKLESVQLLVLGVHYAT